MALNTGVITPGTPKNIIEKNPAKVRIDENVPYIVREGFHAGTIDKSKWQVTIDAYDGIGLNRWGLYGISYDPLGNIPHFLLSNYEFTTQDWGNVTPGEFRVGDNIKEDNGSLAGDNWIWYKPGEGLMISGPVLTSTSSGVNLISSPSFDNTAEFTTSGFVTHVADAGYDGAAYKFSGNGVLTAKGNKTVDGSVVVKGSILYYASADFVGTVSITANQYAVDGSPLGTSNSVISIYAKEQWHRFDYVVRIEDADTFTLSVSVNSSAGNITFDNWSAFKVFQASISTTDLDETVANPTKGLVIDKSGLRGYWGTKDGPLTKTFEVSAVTGNAFLKGNLLVNGTAHTGKLFDENGLEIFDFEWNKVKYFSGCGLNEYGLYGIKAIMDADGKHLSSGGRFLLGAKESGYTDYWGDAILSGELRVGVGVVYDSGNHRLLREDHSAEADAYLWFFPGNADHGPSLKIKGDITASTGHFEGLISVGDNGGMWVGTYPNGCGIGANGIAGGSDNTAKFYLTGKDTPTAGIYPAQKAGELRIGQNISQPLSSNNYGLYLTEANGLEIWSKSFIVNGISSNPEEAAFGGSSGKVKWEDNILHLNGALLLEGVSDPITGTPENYIGVVSSTNLSATYISSDGVAIKNGAGKWQALLLGDAHPWAANGPKFFIGDDYADGAPTGNYLYWDGENLKIKVSGDELVLADTGDTLNESLESNGGGGADWETNLTNIPKFLDEADNPTTKGLYSSNNNFGYYDGSNWKTYMDNKGNFYLGGTGGSLKWYAAYNWLSITGSIYATSGYFTHDFYVGTSSSNNIKISANSGYPYIKSSNYNSGNYGADSKGWMLDYNGEFHCSYITSTSNNFEIHSKNSASSGVAEGTFHNKMRFESSPSLGSNTWLLSDSTYGYYAHLIANAKDSVSSSGVVLQTNGYLVLGNKVANIIDIQPKDSGQLRLGSGPSNIDLINLLDGKISFFGHEHAPQQTATDLDGVIAALQAYGLLA